MAATPQPRKDAGKAAVEATPLKRAVTPYKLAEYLTVVAGLPYDPHRIYRDRQDGRLTATRASAKDRWTVTPEEGRRYALARLSARGGKDSTPAW